MHDLHVVVDYVPTTHAEAAPVPTLAFSSFLAPARPPHPSFAHSQPSALASHRAHAPGSSAAVRCDCAPVQSPPLGACRVCCLSKLRHVTRSSGHPLVHPCPLWFAWSTLTSSLSQLRCRRPVSSPCPGRRLCVPETSLKVTVIAPPLFFPVLHLLARNCSLECSLVRRGPPSVVRSPQSHSQKPDPAIVLAKFSLTSPSIRTDLSRPRSPSLPRLRLRRRRVRGERRPWLPSEGKVP